ncbi:MAG: hypothetical protein HY649_04745 [Acidobacteria bacterium]|nr:hypothetical protein [Acidobacteriota bacterium]
MSWKTMPRAFLLLTAVSLLMGVPICQAQEVSGSASAQPPQFGLTPTQSDIYCAGFFTHRAIERGLFVLGSSDGGFKNEFADRDIIYLSKGQGWITAPGGEYMLLRPVKDINPGEIFPGQHKVVARLGDLYAEIARIQIRVLHPGSATAEVLSSCEPIQAGDIAVPWQARTAPPYHTERIVDRFSPASGKTTGLIAAAKEFRESLGEGNIVYLNVGRNQGAQAGGHLRIFRSYLSWDSDEFAPAARNYSLETMGGSLGHRMSYEERAALPRDVLGAVLLLAVEDDSSTGIITFAREEVTPGDEVELE